MHTYVQAAVHTQLQMCLYAISHLLLAALLLAPYWLSDFGQRLTFFYPLLPSLHGGDDTTRTSRIYKDSDWQVPGRELG